MLRLIAATAGVAALALLPISAGASPSPSPSLDTLLASPPASDYQEDTQNLALQGAFDMAEYVSFLGPSDPTATTNTLKSDGFVSGFGRTWVQQASNHLLIEVVIAFTGGSGAKKWLGTSQELDKKDRTYTGALSINGVESAYGVHFADPSGAAYADVGYFVKGNDYFIIGLVSAADDLGDAVSNQTRRQYDSAPAYTIPPSQWPESARSILAEPLKYATTFAYILGGAAAVALLVSVALLLWWLRKRSGRTQASAVALQVSDDGRYWWDGGAWRESSRDIPPNALRSDDGHYWWDGGEWRLIQEGSS